MKVLAVFGALGVGFLLTVAIGLTALAAGAGITPSPSPAGPGSSPGYGTPGGGAIWTIGGGSTTSQAAVHAVAYAESVIGAPYVWGGSGPSGFDCSGLVWAAYASTAAAFPRMGATDEYRGTPHVPPGVPLHSGDLVFFGDSGGIEHVGLYVGRTSSGNAVMIDAPHSGASVRHDVFSDVTGAYWGNEYFVGATRPSG